MPHCDRLRSAKLHCVFAMQSEASLDPKIGKDTRVNLMNHFTTRFYFQTNNQDEAEMGSKYVGQAKVKKRTINRSKGGRALSIVDEDIYRVKPRVFLSLDEHQAVVVHPSKKFYVGNILPLDPTGKVAKWFFKKVKNLNKISKLKQYIVYK